MSKKEKKNGASAEKEKNKREASALPADAGEGKPGAGVPRVKAPKTPGDPNAMSAQVITVLFWLGAFLTTVFFIANLWGENAPLIRGVCSVLYGLFGWGGLVIVGFFAMMGFEWKSIVVKRNGAWKVTFGLLFVLLISMLVHVILIMKGSVPAPEGFLDVWKAHRFWAKEGQAVGGGFIGGLLGNLFYFLMHGVVSILLLILLTVTDLMFFFSVTPRHVWEGVRRMNANRKVKKAARLQKQAEEDEREYNERQAAKKAAEEAAAKKKAEEEEEARRRGEEEKKREEEARRNDPGIDFLFDEDEGRESREGEDKKRTSPSPRPTPPSDTTPGAVAEVEDTDRYFNDPKPPRGGTGTSLPAPRDTRRDLPDYAFADHLPEGEEEDRFADTDFGYGLEDEPEQTESGDFFDGLFDDDKTGEMPPADTPSGAFPEDDLFAPVAGLADMDEEEDPADEYPADEYTGKEEPPFAPDDPEPAPLKPAYVFPPLSLLAKPEPAGEEGDSREELVRKGHRLEEVLRSFHVDTEMVNISCGPTITRYELVPKSGVRVRSIANLVDDIALNLETSGVRIEAPIPGKAAVGIEVPNKSQSTVYLRTLLESDGFQNAKSKLTVGLGVDVSGAPVLMDIAKMPHLLIAGATGMGKSVCANSIIMSLLYKADPDEVKLILIDPKKVEFNVYNKLPHLLIPVVTNPKKAAGALATAVNEMERRFELIEAAGVRDIKGYNKIAASDPNRAPLPQIVIIIDELADMMLIAKDDVESSICRLAQLARAAGIHLIICTQRPSVDVITGLIKANVPSRIALTVASMVDSRTIIDVAGAEKLIGKGDMLYAPVGCMKPIRSQGAFVSEAEVEAVTGFIREQVSEVQYDDSFLNMVEVEAEKCGNTGKKKAAVEEIDGDDDLDPKFYDAVEIAVEMGKISTSLLQRRLSLGYGRAAKIIDRMEQMGVVGPQEGQKPRTILITRQDYQEMILHRDDMI